MNINIFAFVSSIFKKRLKNLYTHYLSINKVDICNVSYLNNECLYNTNSLQGSFVFNEKVLDIIRLECGNNTLMKNGIPLKDDTIPIIYLQLDISFVKKSIKEFGIKKTIELIRNWCGKSESNGVCICKYKVLGQIN